MLHGGGGCTGEAAQRASGSFAPGRLACLPGQPANWTLGCDLLSLRCWVWTICPWEPLRPAYLTFNIKSLDHVPRLTCTPPVPPCIAGAGRGACAALCGRGQRVCAGRTPVLGHMEPASGGWGGRVGGWQRRVKPWFRRATGRAVGALEARLLVGAFLISWLQSAGLATPGLAHSTLPPLDRLHSDPCPRSCPPCSLGSGPLVLH